MLFARRSLHHSYIAQRSHDARNRGLVDLSVAPPGETSASPRVHLVGLVDAVFDGVVEGLAVSDVHHRHECEAMLYRALYEIVGVSSQRLTCNLHRFILDAFTRRGMHVCRATMDQLAEFKEIVCPYVGRACNSL